MNTMIMTFTIASMLLIVYHHVGYPLILRLVQKYKTKDVNNNGRQQQAEIKQANINKSNAFGSFW